jgi:flagellar biosynthesis GTPase FlhF
MPRELASAIGEVAASTLLPLLPGADAADLVRDALMRRIPVAPLGRGAGVVGFVGPAGAGKTYCAARLAVAHARHGVFPVAVISLRPPDGGAELTRLLAPHRIPIHAVATGAEAAATVRDLRGHGLVIIDTPGVSPRSRVELRTLGMELGRIGPDELHLVVSATIGSGQGHELIDGLRELGVSALLITHTDETDHVGTLVGLAIETQIPVSYVARSQASDAGLRPATAAGLAALVGYGGTADGSSRPSRPVAR